MNNIEKSSSGLNHFGAFETVAPNAADLVCLSHLRWDFVFQRPQHLLTRFARERRVFFFEEPLFDASEPRLDISERAGGVQIVVPHLPPGLGDADCIGALSGMVDWLVESEELHRYVAGTTRRWRCRSRAISLRSRSPTIALTSS